MWSKEENRMPIWKRSFERIVKPLRYSLEKSNLNQDAGDPTPSLSLKPLLVLLLVIVFAPLARFLTGERLSWLIPEGAADVFIIAGTLILILSAILAYRYLHHMRKTKAGSTSRPSFWDHPLVNHNISPILILDPDTLNIKYSNPAAGFLFDLNVQRIQQTNFLSLCPLYQSEEVQSRTAIRSAISTLSADKPIMLNWQFRSTSKEDISSQIQIALHEEHSSSHVICSIMDLSHQKKMEETYYQNIHNLEAFIGAVDSVLIGLNKQLDIIIWNQHAHALLPDKYPNPLGMSFFSLSCNWDWEIIHQAIASCRYRQTPMRVPEIKLMTPDGEEKYLLLVFTPLPAQSEQQISILITATDITETRHLYVEMLATERTELIGQLAADIAHGINSPMQYISDNLAFISSQFEQLQKLANSQIWRPSPHLSADHPEFAEGSKSIQDWQLTIQDSMEEVPMALTQSRTGISLIMQLIQALQNFPAPEKVEPQNVKLREIIDNVLAITHSSWSTVAALDVSIPEEESILSCYPADLTTALIQLVMNAVRAIERQMLFRSGQEGQIQIQVRNETDEIEIRVNDNGRRYALDYSPALFNSEEHHPVNPVEKDLRLASIRQAVIERHHGRFDYQSSEDAGNTFRITLPVQNSRIRTAE